MASMPNVLQSQPGWDAERNRRTFSCCSGAGSLVCLLRQVFCFLSVCLVDFGFFVYGRRSWRTGSKIFSDEHTSAAEFTFSS